MRLYFALSGVLLAMAILAFIAAWLHWRIDYGLSRKFSAPLMLLVGLGFASTSYANYKVGQLREAKSRLEIVRHQLDN